MEYDGADVTMGGARFGIVASRWYPELMDALINGAKDALLSHGVDAHAIDIARVPGSFELPMGAKVLVDTGRYDAVICLGIVIRGETTHYDYVAGESARGITDLALTTGVPVLLGVVTCENREQALARSGGAKGNKGAEAAEAAIEMIGLIRAVSESVSGRRSD